MAIKNDREYRSFFDIKAREKEDGSYIVEGYATTLDDPYVLWKDGDVEVKEQIARTAFDDADMSDVIFLYNHEGMVYARQKNGTLALDVDERGLKVTADLGSIASSRELYEAIQSGLVDQMSWAFTVKEEAYDKEQRLRTITKVDKVYDVSAVSIPANPATSISARDYFNGVIEVERAERLRAEERERARKKIHIKLKMEA